MAETGLLIIAIAAFVFAILAQKLSTTVVTAPIIFLALGCGLALTGWFDRAAVSDALYVVAEIALVVLLFFDASQTDLKALKQHHLWPKRMLVFGLPVAVLIGTAANALFLPGWPLVALALVAALLAPTDAALGQAVITNPSVPERVRRSLTVESGLNDGLALPLILLFASLTGEVVEGGERNWFAFGAMQLILGPLVGVAIGYVGGKLMIIADDRKWTSGVYEGISALAIAAAAYLCAGEIGGNGFIATFVAGLTFGNTVKGRFGFVFEFTDSEGQILMWAAFLLLGLGLLPEAIAALTWPVSGLIIVSLFVVRPAAIWLSLLGTDASWRTKLFFGWFGPRGLATALFALLILPQIGGELAEQILAIAINAVWISALLHGASAAPLGRIYGRVMQRLSPDAEHSAVVPPFGGAGGVPEARELKE